MAKDPAILRKRFAKYIQQKWTQNDHSLKEISCVYALLSFTYGFSLKEVEVDIKYIGSTTKLFSRYKSHKIPEKIQASGCYSILYFLPMKKGFYDYEIKLIKKLSPEFNKQHILKSVSHG